MEVDLNDSTQFLKTFYIIWNSLNIGLDSWSKPFKGGKIFEDIFNIFLLCKNEQNILITNFSYVYKDFFLWWNEIDTIWDLWTLDRISVFVSGVLAWSTALLC